MNLFDEGSKLASLGCDDRKPPVIAPRRWIVCRNVSRGRRTMRRGSIRSWLACVARKLNVMSTRTQAYHSKENEKDVFAFYCITCR